MDGGGAGVRADRRPQPSGRRAAFEEAERLRILDVSAIERLIERSHGRRGLKPLATLLRDHRHEAPPTRNDFERDFLDLCKDAGLPLPVMNSIVEGYEVDALWPERKIIVELDSRAFHDNDPAFETDRVRDAVLQLAGYKVLRVTWKRLQREPAVVAGQLRQALR
jgi:hypothetical protein